MKRSTRKVDLTSKLPIEPIDHFPMQPVGAVRILSGLSREEQPQQLQPP